MPSASASVGEAVGDSLVPCLGSYLPLRGAAARAAGAGGFPLPPTEPTNFRACCASPFVTGHVGPTIYGGAGGRFRSDHYGTVVRS
jgi:hypothetical protein